MELRKDVCPYCGGTETVIAKHTENDRLVPRNAVIIPRYAKTILNVVCLNCGTIIRRYVENPEDLL